MKYLYTFLLLSSIVLQSHYAYADPEDTVRLYLGAKLGYHGLIPSSIHDLSSTISGRPSTIDINAGVISMFTLGGAIGMHIQITPRLRSRTEFEYMYHFEGKTKRVNDGTQQFSRLTLASHTMLVNTYIDYDIVKFIALYVGVGVGASILEVDISKERSSGKYKDAKIIPNFAWQIGFGTRIELTEYIFLDANFRYLNLGPINPFGNPTTVRMGNTDNNAIELLFSAVYTF